MLTYFTKILSLLIVVFSLSACSSSTSDDERYGFIEGNFPLLGEIPDRPTALTEKEINDKIINLEKDRDEAQTQAKNNFDLTKK